MKLPFIFRILVSITVVSVMVVMVAIKTGIASDEETKKREMKKIEKDLTKEREEFTKFGEKEKNLLEQLATLEKNIEKKKTLLEGFKRNISKNKRDLKVQQERLKQSELALIKIEDRLNRRLVAFYKYAKRGYVQLLSTSKGIEEFRKRIKYLKVIMDEDFRLFKQMVDIQSENKTTTARINDKIAAINQIHSKRHGR